jgi:FKBP-type peptidyl-prolyl cis-trans isomerase
MEIRRSRRFRESDRSESMKTAYLIGLAAAIWACGSGEGGTAQVEFASELGVDLASMTESSGLWISDLAAGEGAEATDGAEVVVHYTGWLADGTMFESSLERGESLSFTLGEGQMIKGWDEGVVGMQVGGKRRLVLPPEMAYGRRGAPPVIPANATLVFEIELLQIR